MRDIRIYNLFPRLYKNVEDWYAVAQSAKDMGFNALYLNPFLKTGGTNSIYAIYDYYEFDMQVFSQGTQEENMEKLKNFLLYCEELGLLPIFDLVINHSAMDSHLVKEHPEWYRHDEQGNILPATTYTLSGILVTWGDCARFKYADRENGLWQYIEELCRYYLDIGFKGFRCDVAHHVPDYYWRQLIGNLRADYPDVLFIGEAFLASSEETLGLADAGFDYIFNSARWWDYSSDWYFDHNESLRIMIPNIGFPDNHDTMRLMHDYDGNLEKCIQKLFFTAVVASGFMMTNGFEYGFQQKLDVHNTTPASWENTGIDIRNVIKEVLSLRERYAVFRQEGCLKRLESRIPGIIILLKVVALQAALLFLNQKDETIKVGEEELESFPYYAMWEARDEPLCLAPYGFGYRIVMFPQDIPAENDSLFLMGKEKFVRCITPVLPLEKGEVLVKVSACGICGSDYYEYHHGPFYWKPSYTGGHEFTGVVCAVSDDVEEMTTGDKVVYRMPRSGTGIVQGGGYSAYVVVKSNCLFKLERRIRTGTAVMIEPLAVAVHAVELVSMLDAGLEKRVAICGSGTLALLLERYLSYAYPEWEITLFYKHAYISELVSPKTCCYNIFSGEKVDTRFQCIFECSGDAGNMERMLSYLEKEGQLILMGIYGSTSTLNYSDMMFSEKRIQGSFLYTEENFSVAARLICEKEIDVQDMVCIMPFEAYREAFSMPSDRRIKTVLRFEERREL